MTTYIRVKRPYIRDCCMPVRSFCLLAFALPSLAARALPPADVEVNKHYD
ncbi:MAG: hypothetical protein NVS4B3_27980 [Gemmatimonadaceae bacterium]